MINSPLKGKKIKVDFFFVPRYNLYDLNMNESSNEKDKIAS